MIPVRALIQITFMFNCTRRHLILFLLLQLSIRDATLLSIPPELDAPPLKPTQVWLVDVDTTVNVEATMLVRRSRTRGERAAITLEINFLRFSMLFQFVALPTSTFGELRERLRRCVCGACCCCCCCCCYCRCLFELTTFISFSRLHVSRAGYNEYRIGVISGAGQR